MLQGGMEGQERYMPYLPASHRLAQIIIYFTEHWFAECLGGRGPVNRAFSFIMFGVFLILYF